MFIGVLVLCSSLQVTDCGAVYSKALFPTLEECQESATTVQRQYLKANPEHVAIPLCVPVDLGIQANHEQDSKRRHVF
jgi:hypothetical protein